MGCGMITERERQLLDWIAENPLISQQELADKAGITRSSVAVHISNLMKKGFIQGKGYILQMSPYVVVVGAVNIDIAGMPFRRLVSKDSNPGTVHMSLGGVGRNIAHNLALLDVEVKFITAFGEDIHAGEIQHSCRENGIDITHSRSVSGASTSTYMFITDENGDMQLAVSDMEIYSYLTPEYIASKLDVINNASLCVIDTNLPAETIQYLCENCTVPIFADPVSTAKAVKLLPVLGKIHTIKPNMLEAALLTGIPVTDERSARKAVDILLELGVQQVFLSMGAAGVLYGNARGKKRIPNYPAEIRNTTGAGDSFMAALVMAYLSEFSTEKAARCGLAAAAICIEGENPINEKLSRQAILDRISEN